MRRPSLGGRIMRGMLLIWQKTNINMKNGYIPSWWGEREQRDVKAALKYMGSLYDWFVDFHSEKNEHDKGDDHATADE